LFITSDINYKGIGVLFGQDESYIITHPLSPFYRELRVKSNSP
jgi:hypothetical protein